MLELLQKLDQEIITILDSNNFDELPYKVANRLRLVKILQESGINYHEDQMFKYFTMAKVRLLRELKNVSKEKRRHLAYSKVIKD